MVREEQKKRTGEKEERGIREYLGKRKWRYVTFKEKGRKGRWKRRRRRTETIIALSYHCTVINFLLSRESVPRLGPDDKPLPPCTAALAIYDQATYTS